MERLGLALFKVHESVRLMGLWHTANAHVYLKSLEHDVLALERLARKVNKGVKAHLQCQGVTNVWSLWWAPAGALALWPCVFYIRKRLYTPKSEKIY
eukprot:gene30549-35579_t